MKCKHKAVEDVERGEVVCNRCGEVLSDTIMILSPSDWKSLGGPLKEVSEATDYVDVKLRKVTVKWLRLSTAVKVVAKSKVYYRKVSTKAVAVTVTFSYRRKRRALILPWCLMEKLIPHIYVVWAQRRKGPRVRDSKRIAEAVRAVHRALTEYGIPNSTTVTAALVKLTERRVQQLLTEEQKSRSHVERGKKARKAKRKKAKKSRRCK